MLLTAQRDVTVSTNAGISGRLDETPDAFARQNCGENRCIWLAMVSSVSPETEHTPAEVLMVSRELPAAPVSDSSLLWRAPEGPEGLAAVPVDGGGAWPGFETTRRAKLAARTASGRAAAHRHTQRPGPTAPGTPAAPHNRPATPKGRAPKYPPPCRLTQPLPRRGSGRIILSPGDGDASTGTCRPRRPLPGPLHRSDRRSPCAQDAEPHRYSGPWPEPQARRNRSSRP